MANTLNSRMARLRPDRRSRRSEGTQGLRVSAKSIAAVGGLDMIAPDVDEQVWCRIAAEGSGRIAADRRGVHDAAGMHAFLVDEG